MSYIDKVVTADERILYRASVSKIIYFPFVLGIIAALVVAYAPLEPMLQNYRDDVLLLVLAYNIYTFVMAWVARSCTELAVTDRRVIAKFGFIGRHSFEISNDKIESIEVDQTIMGRIFNFGTLVIKGTGSGHVPIPTIDNPLEFQRAVGDR